MAVNLQAPRAEDLLPVAGVRLGVAAAGIRKPGRDDLTLILLDEGSHAAGVFTQNRLCAAPVQVCRRHLEQGSQVRALVINTGIANAGTGAAGLGAAQDCCAALAQQLRCRAEQVLPFSTGVIMEPLPTDRLLAGLPAALAQAAPDNWLRAAGAIMTTDTLPKACSLHVALDGTEVTITGMAKGSGMIRPDMATMLAFVATDARVEPRLLQELLRRVAQRSFNRITVDGDTSTNDSFILLATGQAGHAPITDLESRAGRALEQGLLQVAQQLAQAIVRDGEGATKFITVRVEQARDAAEARQVAYAIAHSPLVKTAFFASDPNLGRILAAVGYAGVDDLDASAVDLYLDEVHVAAGGSVHPDYREEQGQRVMNQPEITVRVVLGRGSESQTIWTCDLSHDYVRINADYRS